ncbi:MULTISPECIES: site-specific integrase [unclassified Caballeronia]|uniref:site-specific integrase n=1 Tax=unclassified Caballeronia TaxID=2646786 RepID=UPI0020289E57|nr:MULTISPECIES: site-specific integrase [unclassified Caballeronia]
MNARRRQAARRNWPANLYQNSTGYLWFRNPENGKTVGLGTDLQSAIRQVKRANLELARRKEERDLLSITDEQGAITLATHCDAYEKEYAVGKINTVSAIKSQLRAIRASDLSKKQIDKFSPKDAADMIKAAVENRGATMAVRIRTRLKDVFRDAILNGLVEKNPVDAVLTPKVKVTRARLQIDDFWRVYEQGEQWLKNAMLLALLTGQRREDICRMRFDDAKDGYLWVEQSKTGAKLKIPLTVGVAGHTLEGLISQCRDSVVSKYLVHFQVGRFHSKAGTALRPGTLTESFAEARDKAQIETPEGATPTSFHEIRSLSARLYSQEIGKDFAQAILGHRSAAMTELYKDVRGQQWVEIRTNFG